MIKVTDKFQDFIDKSISKKNISNLTVLNDIIFYSIFIYYYYFGNFDDNLSIIKYTCIFFVLRYFLNYITTYKVIKNKVVKNNLNFILNSKIAIFSILVLFLLKCNSKLGIILIFLYSLLNSAIKYGYTSNNLLTIIVVYYLFFINLNKKLI